jgi:hypothetical protein
MAQAKKKTSTKTAKKSGAAQGAHRKATSKTTKYKQVSAEERMHLFLVIAMSMIAGILLCADVAMMIV